MRYPIRSVVRFVVHTLLFLGLLQTSPALGETQKQVAGSGHALSFNGNHLATLVGPTALDLTADSRLTLEAWIRRTSNTPYWQVVLTKGSSGEEYGLSVSGDRTLQFELGENWAGRGLETSNGVVPFNTWVHVAGVWDGSTMRVYVNGVYQGVTPYSSPVTATDDPFVVGAANLDDIYEEWYGQIDEIRLWNVARTEQEIHSASATALIGDEPGLVAYWNFDEGAGQIASDVTSNGYDLNLGLVDTPDSRDPAWVLSNIPSFMPAVESEGRIRFDANAYPCSATVSIELLDRDLSDATATVSLSNLNGTDMETVVLARGTTGIAFYSGEMALSQSSAVSEDGVLQAEDGNALYLVYDDLDTGDGTPGMATATASIDCSPPGLVDAKVEVSQTLTGHVKIETDEPARLVFRYGLSCAAVDAMETSSEEFQTIHEFHISDLNPSSVYYYQLELTDPTGNHSELDNGGGCFDFRTPTLFPPRILAFTRYSDVPESLST